MTISTRMIGLFMTLALGGGVALGQGPLLSNPGDAVPPDLQLPLPMPGSTAPLMTQQPMGPQDYAATGAYAVTNPDNYDVNGGCDYSDGGGLWNEVAPIESTGTWLRRGFWYAETDAVIFNRIWFRKDLRLAAQDANV